MHRHCVILTSVSEQQIRQRMVTDNSFTFTSDLKLHKASIAK